MRPCLAIVVGLCVLPVLGASAQQGDPGTRLILERDDGPARMALSLEEEPDAHPKEGISIGVRGRYQTVHDAFLRSFLLNHTSLNGWATGLEIGIDGPMGGRIIFGLDYGDLSFPAGNWRASGARPQDSSYTEIDLGLVALDTTFLWKVGFNDVFGFDYGLSVGLGYLVGTITSTDVLPNCLASEDVPNCAHWQEVTRRRQQVPPDAYPTRVVPILGLQGGLYVTPADGWQIRADVGYRLLLFYTGLAVRSTF